MDDHGAPADPPVPPLPGGGAGSPDGDLLCGHTGFKITAHGLVPSVCTRKYRHLSGMYRHRAAAHYRATCAYCLRGLKERDLEEHARGCTEWIKCAICSVSIASKDDALSHYGNFHSDEIKKLTESRSRPDSNPPRSENRKSFGCNTCGELFTRKDNLKKHKKNRCVFYEPMPCRRCGRKFRLFRNLAWHLKSQCQLDGPP